MFYPGKKTSCTPWWRTNHSLKKDTVRGFNPPEKYVRLKLDNFPNFRGEQNILLSWVYYFTGKLKHFINSWFKGMITNLWMGHGCFVKHPFKSSCLEFQKYNHIYALPIQTKHLLLIVARNPDSFLTFIFQRNLQKTCFRWIYLAGSWIPINVIWREHDSKLPSQHRKHHTFFRSSFPQKRNGTPPKSNIQRPKIAICVKRDTVSKAHLFVQFWWAFLWLF